MSERDLSGNWFMARVSGILTGGLLGAAERLSGAHVHTAGNVAELHTALFRSHALLGSMSLRAGGWGELSPF